MDNGIVYDLSGGYGSNRINYQLNGSLNASWGPQSQFTFHPGDLKNEGYNLNLDLSYAINEMTNLAWGVEWRRETYTMFAGDRQSWQAGPWANSSLLIDPGTGAFYTAPGTGANGLAGTDPDAAGSFNSENFAAYVDAEYSPMEAFLIQGALRFEDYKEFGSTFDFKVASRYTIADGLNVRGAFSTGFRAPTPGQANVTTIVTSFDGVTGLQVLEGTVRPTDPLAVSIGGTALVPEEATNISIGVAAALGSSLSFTADFYRVEVDKRIIKSRSLPVTGDPSRFHTPFSAQVAAQAAASIRFTAST